MITPVNTRERWTAAMANDWYRDRAWPVGCNFIPSSAVNQLEMWQAETFDPEAIDRELGWAGGLGFNAARVFLHDLPWSTDASGLLERMERLLGIAAGHGISVMFVLFDGVWDPEPASGRQRPPRPHIHNPGWVQSPGAALLADERRHGALADYVRGVVAPFANDPRVLAWDLFNEPDNPNIGTYQDHEPAKKAELAERLLAKAFTWAREAGPSQPLTAGVWRGRASGEDAPSINRLMLEESDVISFHSYFGPDLVARRIDDLARYGRPLLLTEFMSRNSGSTFEALLPLLKERRVGAFCWGLVSGKTQTIYPWDSWRRPYDREPETWFHDVLRPDGTPYREDEAALIRKLAD
jgi:hypothetical protein